MTYHTIIFERQSSTWTLMSPIHFHLCRLSSSSNMLIIDSICSSNSFSSYSIWGHNMIYMLIITTPKILLNGYYKKCNTLLQNEYVLYYLPMSESNIPIFTQLMIITIGLINRIRMWTIASAVNNVSTTHVTKIFVPI